MKHYKDRYIFKHVNDLFICINKECITLAEMLKELDIIVDDKCTFARFKDYNNDMNIIYRVINLETIDIRINYNEE